MLLEEQNQNRTKKLHLSQLSLASFSFYSIYEAMTCFSTQTDARLCPYNHSLLIIGAMLDFIV